MSVSLWEDAFPYSTSCALRHIFRKSETFAPIWPISLRRLGGSDVPTKDTAPTGLRGARCGLFFCSVQSGSSFMVRKEAFHEREKININMSDEIKHEFEICRGRLTCRSYSGPFEHFSCSTLYPRNIIVPGSLCFRKSLSMTSASALHIRVPIARATGHLRPSFGARTDRSVQAYPSQFTT